MQDYLPLRSAETAKPFAGIYCILNTQNNRRYVGKACPSIGHRLKGHLHLMVKGKHHSKLMQADFDQQGEQAFHYTVLEVIPCQADASDFLLDAMEHFWIGNFNPEYNTLKNGLLRCRFKESLQLARKERRELHQEINSLSKRISLCSTKLTVVDQRIEMITHWLEKRQKIMQP